MRWGEGKEAEAARAFFVSSLLQALTIVSGGGAPPRSERSPGLNVPNAMGAPVCGKERGSGVRRVRHKRKEGSAFFGRADQATGGGGRRTASRPLAPALPSPPPATSRAGLPHHAGLPRGSMAPDRGRPPVAAGMRTAARRPPPVVSNSTRAHSLTPRTRRRRNPRHGKCLPSVGAWRSGICGSVGREGGGERAGRTTLAASRKCAAAAQARGARCATPTPARLC